ncbi:pyrroline-5-carboxylate reductase [Actinobacillus succinogenes]|uniref:Pyrroline-5-carboxylate reductase n=1 Tax=Actinobacillus succinogenes (strain ATCC 55618 / DSM 22257 / CCUG 43843 / 130Z) TaxID=339671 RepID=A6VQ69_ACTSZ|nr:pyrroline-5-carboxylate reductase [Actinobacillus succinogenes]ABR75116.1 pyrroline-5-carboxylate reductase [Actinobacillus succinogenes 130Z]PHI40486.1 pyrroline-5-carboxylate reductase [Actinobacillus succinogenes]
MSHKSLYFIGGGNMAQAIVFGLLKQGYPADKITVCDRNQAKRDLFAAQGVRITQNPETAAVQAEIVVLAIKPQAAAELAQSLSAVDFSDKLLISIMAAIPVRRLTALFPTVRYIVRVMPNTPALVSAAMSGLFAPENVPDELKRQAAALLTAVGEICWVEKESDMHIVTAASGSSPAYFFLFMEAMQQTLLTMGLTDEQARKLIQQSALGAAKMAIENPQTPLSLLRENVTSKGGTTAAALAVFNEHQFARTLQLAMQACVARSQEMEKLF